MDEFPSLSSKHYQELRRDIRSGDILMCSGSSILSTLIQKATNSIWSHVAFILRLYEIDRIMVFESVESIGVRAIPLSSYLHDYNGTGKSYPGRLMLARHNEVKQENMAKLSRHAINFLGYPYRTEELVHIISRLSLHSLGLPPEAPDPLNQRAFICSEYANICFRSIGINIEYNPLGFIAPADFIRNPHVKPICYIKTETSKRAAPLYPNPAATKINLDEHLITT